MGTCEFLEILKSYEVYDWYEVSEKYVSLDKDRLFENFEKYKVGIQKSPFDENQMSVF